MEIDWQDIAGQLQQQVGNLSLQLAVANAQIAKLTGDTDVEEADTDG